MTNSGLANSPLFTHPKQNASLPVPREPIEAKESPLSANEDNLLQDNEKQPASNQAVKLASKQVSKQAIKPESKQENKLAWLQITAVESIRKALRFLGKEATTYRFTPEEKRELMDITHSYKVSGFKTTENEIARIAINLIIEDHKEYGRKSIIQTVLNALKG